MAQDRDFRIIARTSAGASKEDTRKAWVNSVHASSEEVEANASPWKAGQARKYIIVNGSHRWV